MYIPGTVIPVYDIIIGVTFFFLLIPGKNKNIISNIFSYKKYLFYRILLIFVLWVLLSGMISIFIGYYNFFYALYAILILFLYNDLLWFLYPSVIFPKFLSVQALIKIFIIGISIICIYGLLSYGFEILNVPILKPINYIVNNRRLDGEGLGLVSNRLLSVFEEPGYLGGFLCINLPIIYSVIMTKSNIFNKYYLNIFYKKFLVPLIWLTIILTKSPIWLIFSIIVSIIFFRKIIIKKFNKISIIVLMLLPFIFLTIQLFYTKVDLSDTYLTRIKKTLLSFGNFDSFVSQEESLANRVLSYIVRVKVFLKYPITGAGYKNTEYCAREIYHSLGFPLTIETVNSLNIYNGKKMHMNGAIFWDTLSDTGLVGAVLYYTFLILLIKKCNTILKFLPTSVEKSFIAGVKNSYIIIICLSFYDIRPNFHYFWFLYGLTICFIKYKQQYLKYYTRFCNGCINSIC